MENEYARRQEVNFIPDQKHTENFEFVFRHHKLSLAVYEGPTKHNFYN